MQLTSKQFFLAEQAMEAISQKRRFACAYLQKELRSLAELMERYQLPFQEVTWTEQEIGHDALLVCKADALCSGQALNFLGRFSCACLVLPDDPRQMVEAAEVLQKYEYYRSAFLMQGIGLFQRLAESGATLVSEVEYQLLNPMPEDAFERLRKKYLQVKQRNQLLEPFYKTADKKIAELSAAYSAISESHMWKATAPLRAVLGQIKKPHLPPQKTKSQKVESEGKVNHAAAEALMPSPFKLIQHTVSVDVVICIYNALEDVKKCLSSVLQCTSEPFHLILVDDNSQLATRSYLEQFAENYPKKVTLIQNDQPGARHGYTYASNIGLRASTGDWVVLLNSDTIVTEGWIDRMILCAQSDPKIGVVGPLSNTASWQSIPEISGPDGDWAHNVLPQGYDVARMGREIAENSGHIYPQTRLLNGFCLMLSRKTIEEIGYMDEETFGRGFAEEDDYNSRCWKAGIRLAVADDTYIFHAQSKSYSNERRMELSALSGKALRKKHGQAFIEQSCAQTHDHFVMDSIRWRTKMLFEREALIEQGKKQFSGKRILFLLPASNAGGGGNVVIQEALAMQRMGVQPEILNLFECKEGFEKSYPNLQVPCRYVHSFYDTEHLAGEYDAVCGTLYSTMKHCRFDGLNNPPKIAYYIQDYEPFFFEDEFSDEYLEAKASYTLIPGCVNVTKTKWNRNTIRSHTGAECIVIGPSVNIDLFRPRKENSSPKKLVVTAMIRPSSPRRGPQMTVRVLRRLYKEFGDYLDLRIFGCDPQKELVTQYFFDENPLDFSCTNYGEISPQQTASLLSQSDVFLDLSSFQAMGLTGMEAMASGCAVVLPIHGGTGSFAKNRENCLLIDTLDEEICFSAAKELCQDFLLRIRLSQCAYRDMCQYYPEKSAFNFLKALFYANEKDKGNSNDE